MKKNVVGILILMFVFSCSSPYKDKRYIATSSTDQVDKKFDLIKLEGIFPKEFEGRSFLKELDKKSIGPITIGVKPELKIKHELGTFFDWVKNNPTGLFKELREKRPFLELIEIPGMRKHIKDSNLNKSKKMVVVTLDKNVRELFQNPEIFSVRLYTHKMDKSVGEFMLAHDKKPVNLEKKWMRAMLKREDGPKIKKAVKELTAKALKEGNINGRIELVNAVARRVPIELTGEYFGFPGPNLRSMYRWSRATQYSYFNNVTNKDEYELKALQAGKEMVQYMTKFLAKKRADKTYENEDTILSRLIKLNVSDHDLMNMPNPTDPRKVINILGTLIGGVETTMQAIVNVVDFLLDNPKMMEVALDIANDDNDELFSKFVWEALRFRPVNPFVFRFTEKDYTFNKGEENEYTIKKGQIVIVATESAMFDPSKVEEPYKFSLNRQNVNAKESEYLHLGYGHHKCLGDYVAEIQVPEVVKQIIQLNGLKRVDSNLGHIGRHDNIGALEEVEDKEESPFPESFVVETDVRPVDELVTMADPRFAFEDYLTNYDRSFFRHCLSATKKKSLKSFNAITSIWKNIKQRKKSTDAVDLYLCRLPKEFHDCIGGLKGARAAKDFDSCREKHLSKVEDFFFDHEVFDAEFNLSDLRQFDSGVKDGNSQFESDLKFYDRADYRQAFMNPVGGITIPEDNKLIFYARLDLRFRKCIFKRTQIRRQTRLKAFEYCQKNQDISLDSLSSKYFREVMFNEVND